MPFTVSHAAAVLPLGRRLSASALVIGAMVPDLPLFVPVDLGDTHSPAAMVTVNILAGLALFVLWHGFFARPVDWFAPSAVRRRLSPSQQPGLRRRLNSPRKLATIVLSLLIGQVTHLFFDLFTHPGTPVTERLAVFSAPVAGLPVYFWAQVALSVVGLLLLAAWALRWFRQAPTYPLQRQPSTLGKLAARGTVVGVAALALVASASAMAGASPKYALFHISVATVVAGGAAAVAVASVWHLRRVGQ